MRPGIVSTPRLRAFFLASSLAALLGLGACAGPGGAFAADDSLPRFRDPAMTSPQAMSAVVVGQSTKADVAAALGAATVVRFDSGFEVWGYRLAPSGGSMSPDGGAEFVVLFTPSGVAARTRVRPTAGLAVDRLSAGIIYLLKTNRGR